MNHHKQKSLVAIVLMFAILVPAALASKDSTDELFEQAITFSESGDPDRAIESYAKALAIEPDRAQEFADKALKRLPQTKACLLRAAGWLGLGMALKAEQDASRVIDVDRRDSRARLIRAKARTILGKSKEADSDYISWQLCGPQMAKNETTRLPDDLIKANEKGVEDFIHVGGVETVYELSRVRADMALSIILDPKYQNDKSALEECAFYAFSPTDWQANPASFYLAGLVYQRLSALDERALPMAEKMFELAIDQDPEYAPAWLELGLMMFCQERFVGATDALERSLKNDPMLTAPYAIAPLCAAYAANDQSERGLLFFDEQYEANPEVSALGIGGALMLYCQGKRSEALSRLKDLLVIEQPGTSEHKYLSSLKYQWEKEKR